MSACRQLNYRLSIVCDMNPWKQLTPSLLFYFVYV